MALQLQLTEFTRRPIFGPMEKTLSLSDAKAILNQLVESVVTEEQEFVITKNGAAVAALIPMDLYEGWRETEAIKQSPEFVAQIMRGLSRLHRKQRRYTLDEVFGEE